MLSLGINRKHETKAAKGNSPSLVMAITVQAIVKLCRKIRIQPIPLLAESLEVNYYILAFPPKRPL